MNSTILLSRPEPALKLVRPSAENWAATLEEERRRLLEDQATLREREENLRRYEARLRNLQEEIEAGRSPIATPGRRAHAPGAPLRTLVHEHVDGDPALSTAWDRLHRAREILVPEQAHLREDRHVLREHETALQRREAAVAVREQRLAEREALLDAAAPVGEPVAAEHTMSAMTRLTRVPFDMARTVFGGKSSKED